MQQNQNDPNNQRQGGGTGGGSGNQQQASATSDQPGGPGNNPGSTRPAPMRPGDEAPAGTPGTGEDLCPCCGGSGKMEGKDCPECSGTGKVTVGIGGA